MRNITRKTLIVLNGPRTQIWKRTSRLQISCFNRSDYGVRSDVLCSFKHNFFSKYSLGLDANLLQIESYSWIRAKRSPKKIHVIRFHVTKFNSLTAGLIFYCSLFPLHEEYVLKCNSVYINFAEFYLRISLCHHVTIFLAYKFCWIRNHSYVFMCTLTKLHVFE